MKDQTKVGFLILAALIAAMIVVVNLGDIRIERGYEFYVLFDDLADLPARPMVKISGVEVGRVTKVDLKDEKARIKVWISRDVKIHRDTRVKILKMGMIGNTYVSLTRGTQEAPLIQQGDKITGVNPLSYEEVIDSFVSGLNEVVQVFQKIGENKDLGGNIGSTFANLRDLTGGINTALGEDGVKLSKAIGNINMVMLNLNRMVKDLDGTLNKETGKITDSIEKLGQAAEELRMMIVDIRAGKGVAGKIIASDEYGEKIGETIDSIYKASIDLKQAVNRFKGFDTSVQASVYYEPDSELFRSYSGLTINSNSGRFLNIAIENMTPPGNTGNHDTGGDRINALTLKAGKRIGNFGVFGGAIRSSGGVGAGWIYKDRLRLQTELFEFNRENPWWNVTSKLQLVKFLSLGLSYEDILDEGSFRAGVEVELE
ncbi:MAG: MlaD family protein [Elusimicrobiota bacterium]